MLCVESDSVHKIVFPGLSSLLMGIQNNKTFFLTFNLKLKYLSKFEFIESETKEKFS